MEHQIRPGSLDHPSDFACGVLFFIASPEMCVRLLVFHRREEYTPHSVRLAYGQLPDLFTFLYVRAVRIIVKQTENKSKNVEVSISCGVL